MDPQRFSYLLFEVAGMLGVLVVVQSLGAARTLLTRRFLVTTAGLYLVWILWDLIAISLNVFSFPTEGNLPLRIFSLPLEEYLFFLFHSCSTWAVVLIAESEDLRES